MGITITKLPKYTNYLLSINFPVTLNLDDLDGISTSDVQKHLDYVLDDWSDGRYNFNVEMLRNALASCLKRAIASAIEEVHQNRYHNQMVPYKSEMATGTTAKWVLTSAKWIKRIDCFLRDRCTSILTLIK